MTNGLRVLALVLCVCFQSSALATTTKYYAYIPDSGRVIVIDTQSNLIVGQIPMPLTYPWSVAVTGDGSRVFVADTARSLLGIDTSTGEIVTRTTVGSNYGKSFGLAVNPQGTRVYSTQFNDSTLSVVDAETGQLIAVIPNVRGGGVAVSPDGRRVYTAGYGSQFYVIDASTNSVAATLELPDVGWGVAVSPGGERIYVGLGRTHRPPLTGVVAIDATSNTIVQNYAVPYVGDPGGPLALSPDGRHLYVSSANDAIVSVVDTSTGAVAAAIAVGSSLYGLDVAPDGQQAFAVNPSGAFHVIDALTNTVVSSLDTGKWGPWDQATVVAFGHFVGPAVPLMLTPIANAGPDQSVAEGATVRLDGSRSSGPVLEFDWRQLAGPTVVLDGGSTATPSFRAPDAPGGAGGGHLILTFELIVTGDGKTSSDTVDVTVASASSHVLDNFNRADGELGANWTGFSDGLHYLISGETGQAWYGGPIYWSQGSAFGTSQEAFVTFTAVSAAGGGDNGLLLKVQSDPVPANPNNAPDWIKGTISVSYDAVHDKVYVSTWRPSSTKWKTYARQPLSMDDGDVFGARALGNGTIEIYRNGTPVATFTLSTADQAFFNDRGGRVGLWFEQAATAEFDDFGGASLVP